jgi:hypothetical protein
MSTRSAVQSVLAEFGVWLAMYMIGNSSLARVMAFSSNRDVIYKFTPAHVCRVQAHKLNLLRLVGSATAT